MNAKLATTPEDLEQARRFLVALYTEMAGEEDLPPAQVEYYTHMIAQLAHEDLAPSAEHITVLLFSTSGTAAGVLRGHALQGHPAYQHTGNPVCGVFDQLYVVPEHRGRGVASYLITAVENWARRKHGVRYMTGHCPEAMLPFYAQYGYSPNHEIIKDLLPPPVEETPEPEVLEEAPEREPDAPKPKKVAKKKAVKRSKGGN